MIVRGTAKTGWVWQSPREKCSLKQVFSAVQAYFVSKFDKLMVMCG